MLLSTPYYRTLTPINTIGYDEEADFNYGPYEIFCIETRLYPTVYKLFGRDVMIVFENIHENNRMDLKIRLVRITNSFSSVVSNQDIEISDEDKLVLDSSINKIISENSEYCLIDRDELYLAGRGLYPKSWYNEVLEYINLPDEYNPYIDENGIYLTFNRASNFKTPYNQVVDILLNKLNEYYENGVVYGASNIAYDWKLERIDVDEVVPKLYKPTWKDKRFAPKLVEFLKEKINGNSYISIRVSPNLVSRHYISSALSLEGFSMIFNGNYIKIQVKNLDEAQYVTSLVLSSQNLSEGKVVTYATNRISWLYLYIEAANKLLNNPHTTGYQVSDTEKPFIFSCLVDKHLSTVSILKELEKMVWTRIGEIDAKKEGDPHAIVMKQYEKLTSE
jgi:hypothetical protein